jgi:hypothetical protein
MTAKKRPVDTELSYAGVASSSNMPGRTKLDPDPNRKLRVTVL